MAYTGRYGNPRRSGAGGTLQSRFFFNANQAISILEEQTGAFRGGGFQRMLAEANFRAARETTRRSLEKLAAETRHTRANTGNLEVTINSDRMYSVTASGFAWGLTSWLQVSPAATYWRVADMGTEPYWTDAAFATGPGTPPVVPLPLNAVRLMSGGAFSMGQARMPQHLEWAVAPQLGGGMNSWGDRQVHIGANGKLQFGRTKTNGDAVLNWVRTREIEIHPAHAKYFMNPWPSTQELTDYAARSYVEGAARLGIPLSLNKA